MRLLLLLYIIPSIVVMSATANQVVMYEANRQMGVAIVVGFHTIGAT